MAVELPGSARVMRSYLHGVVAQNDLLLALGHFNIIRY